MLLQGKMAEEPAGGYSTASFNAGPYKIELAQRGNPIEVRPLGEASFSSNSKDDPTLDVVTGEDRLFLDPDTRKRLHLCQKTLAETALADVRKNHKFATFTEDTGIISKFVESSLSTISKISQNRLAYNPVEYLAKILKIEPMEYLSAEGLKEYHSNAATLALLKILGFYKVEEKADAYGNPVPVSERKGPYVNVEKLEDLVAMLEPDKVTKTDKGVEKIDVEKSDAFALLRHVQAIKEETYLAKTPEEFITILQRPKRTGVAKEDFRFPLHLVGCVMYDKFGEDAVIDLFQNYVLSEDIVNEMVVADQTLTSIDFGSGEKKTEKSVKQASEFTRQYRESEKKLIDLLAKNIIEKNISHMGLFTRFPYSEVMLFDGKNLLPELARIEIVRDDEKARYFLEGNEISFKEEGKFYSGRQAVVDAIEELRKRGGSRPIASIEMGQREDGLKINFNDIFLFAKYGVSRRQFAETELEMLRQLELIVDSEFDFSYEPVHGKTYTIFSGNAVIGKVTIPEYLDISEIQRMSINDAITNPTVQESPICLDIYAMLQKHKKFTNKELADGEVSLKGLLFDKETRKRYRVLRKTKQCQNYEILGEVGLKVDIEQTAGLRLHQNATQDALELSKMRFSGIDYVEEASRSGRGGIHVLRSQGLDELLDEFYQMMGKAGADLNVKAIRVANLANRHYFENVLGKFIYNGVHDEEFSKEGTTITNDDHRRILLHIQFLKNRGLVEHVLIPIAEMAHDTKLSVAERFLYGLYADVLNASGVHPDLVDFIWERVKDAIEIVEKPSIEEQQLVGLIKSVVIRGNGAMEKNPNYQKILGMLTEMNAPRREQAAKFEEMKERYRSGLWAELSKFIDEMLKEKGEDIFADRFLTHFKTTKKALLSRTDRIRDDEKIIEDAGTGIYLLDITRKGYLPKEREFKQYILAMALLPDDIRARVAANVKTWANDEASAELAKTLTDRILNEESFSQIQAESQLNRAWVDSLSNDRDSVIEDPEMEKRLAEMFSVAEQEIKSIQERYKIEPKKSVADVTDSDINDLFGEGI